MSKKKIQEYIDNNFIEEVIIGLHTKAGFTPREIVVCIRSLKESEVSEFLSTRGYDPKSPPVELDPVLGRDIINSGPKDVTIEQLVENEKERFFRYSEIERQALDIMDKLLQHYSTQEPGNIQIDKFRAQLADTFLKNTHSARTELLTKYETQKKAEIAQKDNILQVEFI